MQVLLLKLSICVLNKKKSELMMWGGIIITSISSYPVSTFKLLFSCPCRVKICMMLNGDVIWPLWHQTNLLQRGSCTWGGCRWEEEEDLFLILLLPHRHSTVPILQRWVQVCWIYSEWKNLVRIFQTRVQVCWLWPRANELCIHTPEMGGRFVGSAQRAKRLCTTTHVGFFRVRFLLEPGTN